MGDRLRQAPQGPEGNGMEIWQLRLFVAGRGLESQRLQGVLETLCQRHLAGRYRIALVDILQDPEQADAFDIVATPTLIRQSPPPPRRVIGDLSETHSVVLGLGMPGPKAS